MTKRPTEQEKLLLQRHYTGDGERTIKLALALNVGRRTVRRWAKDLGLTDPAHRWPNRATNVAATTKKRNTVANISRPAKFTGHTLANLLQVPAMTITRWVKLGWLPNRRRKTSTRENPYAFTDTDVGLLLVKHWPEVFPEGPSAYQSETLVNDVLAHGPRQIEAFDDATAKSPPAKRQAARSLAARGGPGGDA